MQTAEKLRADIAQARTAALMAPNAEAAAPDWRAVNHLEAELRAVEAAATHPDLIAIGDLRRELIAARNDLERASRRNEWLTWQIEQQIGRPIAGMSQVKVGQHLSDIKRQREMLARWIFGTHTLDDLQSLKAVARNMNIPMEGQS